MKRATLIFATFLMFSTLAATAGAVSPTRAPAGIELPALFNQTGTIVPRLDLTAAPALRAPVVVTEETLTLGARAWTQDPGNEPAPPPPPDGGYQGGPAQPAPAPAQPAPMQPGPAEESNFLLYTVVTVAVVVGLVVLVILAGEEDDGYDEYKKSGIAPKRGGMLTFSF